MSWSRRRIIGAALLGAVVTVVATVVTLNFMTSESEIETSLVHRYGIDDPQFRRELSILLGPPIIDGNRVDNLKNDVEIFSAMLEAIRGAVDDHVRELHLLVRSRGQGIRRCVVRTRPSRRACARAHRLGRQPGH